MVKYRVSRIAMTMDASDAHLESVLEELNERVNELEGNGSPEELMEAYVNRGNVLMMLGYRTSALDDLISADDAAKEIESAGTEIDAGTFVKIHTTMGHILFDMEQDPTEEYRLASTRLDSLKADSRHYDGRAIVRMCMDSVNDLLDYDDPDDSWPYIEKASSSLRKKNDHWSSNRRFDILNLKAEVQVWQERFTEAHESYSEAIDEGLRLMEEGSLEDPSDLAMTFAARADIDTGIGLGDMQILDLKSAVTVLENLIDCGRLPDMDLVIGLHHSLAEALMKGGNIAEAEKHLMRAMELGVRGAGDYMRIQTPSGKSS